MENAQGIRCRHHKVGHFNGLKEGGHKIKMRKGAN